MNMRAATLALGAISALCVVVSSGSSSAATLIGSSVSGVLNFGGGTDNLFDPVFGSVPSGFGNSAPHGPNNVIIGSGVEFGFQEFGLNEDTADFTASSVTLQDLVAAPEDNLAITMTFTDALFTGATVTLASDNFPSPATETLVGDVLTLSVPEHSYSAGGPFDATFNITPLATTPLPATLPLFATGLGVLGLLGWRRKRKAHGMAAPQV